jgi:hypothetical protein
MMNRAWRVQRYNRRGKVINFTCVLYSACLGLLLVLQPVRAQEMPLPVNVSISSLSFVQAPYVGRQR